MKLFARNRQLEQDATSFKRVDQNFYSKCKFYQILTLKTTGLAACEVLWVLAVMVDWMGALWFAPAETLLGSGLRVDFARGRRGASGAYLAGGGEYKDADGNVSNLHSMGWPSSLRLWYLLIANSASFFWAYTTSAHPLPSILQLLNPPTTPNSSSTSCCVTAGCRLDTVTLVLDEASSSFPGNGKLWSKFPS